MNTPQNHKTGKLAKTREGALVHDHFSREELNLLKRTIAVGATDDEFRMFVAICNRSGLDPFAKQIYLIKRKRWNAQTQSNDEYASIEVSIDGARLIAERTGERNGEEGPLWCNSLGEWFDVWTPDGPPKACKMSVYRKGHERPYTGIAYWNMHAQTKRNGELTAMWAKGGPNMLAKCAERLALAKAFPVEMAQSEPETELEAAPLLESGFFPTQTEHWYRAAKFAVTESRSKGPNDEKLIERFWASLDDWWNTHGKTVARLVEDLNEPGALEDYKALCSYMLDAGMSLGIPRAALVEYLDAREHNFEVKVKKASGG